jgi:hypothetical protein
VRLNHHHHHHHHHREHGQGLGLKTCSFEAQGVPGPSILLSVFPYAAIPEVGTGRPTTLGTEYLSRTWPTHSLLFIIFFILSFLSDSHSNVNDVVVVVGCIV